MNRRGFLGAALSPLLVPLLPTERLQTFTPLRFLTDVRPTVGTKGQTVEDIIVGFAGLPCDRTCRLTFYRESQPQVAVLTITLNQRASFRWVPNPGLEIVILSGDRLLWHTEAWPAWSDNQDNQAFADVWMQGRDRATGQVVVNQGIVVP